VVKYRFVRILSYHCHSSYYLLGGVQTMNKSWKEEDILNLIKNQIEEISNLDYKTGKSLNKSLDPKN
jgi:hypothetical protein